MGLLRKALFYSAFFCACNLSGQAWAEGAHCFSEPSGAWVEGAYAIDGDTLVLRDGRKVRVLGINTPELARGGRPDEPLARRAKRAAQQFIAGQRIRLIRGPELNDRYGRVLAFVQREDGSDISAHLLNLGLAWAAVVPPNDEAWRCLREREKQARSARRGLWAQAIKSPADIDSGGFNLLRGRVTKINRSASALWVELDGLVVLRFAQRDLALDPLLAKFAQSLRLEQALEVRGWLVDRGESNRYSRWLLPILHRGMLELDAASR